MKTLLKTLIGDVDSFVLVSLFLMVCFFTVLSLTTGCHRVGGVSETDTDEVLACDEFPKDVCDAANTIHLFEQSDDCEIDEYTEECKHGCVDEGESGSVRCLDACELNPCGTPEPRCESTTFYVEYKQSTCVIADNEQGYNCVENIGTRWLCGCVDATDEKLAHCYEKEEPDTDDNQDKPSDYYDH